MTFDLERVRLENRGLPTDEHGAIRSPRYLRPGESYAEKWREWLRLHPPKERPEWLRKDLIVMRGSK